MKKTLIVLVMLLLTGCGAYPDLYVQNVQSSFYLTGTAAAPLVSITQTAAAMNFSATEQAQAATATAQYYTPTPVPTATPNMTATVAVDMVMAQRTALAINSERDRLELERQAQNNAFLGAAPGLAFVFVAGALIIALLAVLRSQRYKPMETDKRTGKVIPVMDTQAGTITNPDAMPNYRGQMSDEAIVAAALRAYIRQRFGLDPELPLITETRQNIVTERAQIIELARSQGGRGGRLTAQALPQLPSSAPAPTTVIRVVAPAEVQEWLDDVQGQIETEATT